MANLFINLPLPAFNGVGVAVAADTLGKDKTIVVGGSFPGATITVEGSTDGGTVWAPCITIQDGDGKLKEIEGVFTHMRTRVSGRTAISPFTGVNVDVGAPNEDAVFASLPFPVGVGAGASVDVSTMGIFKNIIMGGGTWARATASIQISEDGTSWTYALSFNSPGIKKFTATAQFARIFVTGGAIAGVTATIGAELSGGGGGGGGALTYLPECWQQQDVPANQSAAPMAAGVSQIFDDFQMDRPGSLAGINLRFNAVLAAGSATAVVTINGVASALTVTVSDPDADGRATSAAGAIPLAAGDVVGVTLETDVDFDPDGSLDAEASVSVHV